MSAFVVSRAHVRYLVEAAASPRLSRYQHDVGLSWVWDRNREAGTYERSELHVSDYESMALIASELMRENVASVEHRYPDTVGHPERRPGMISEQDLAPEFTAADFSRGVVEIEPAQVLNAISCYKYQACEHPAWDASEARAFCEALYRKAANTLADEDAARRGVELQWEIKALPTRASFAPGAVR